VSGYEVVSVLHTANVNGNNTTTGVAACPAGKRIIGGGFEGVNVNLPVYPVSSFPSAVDNTWRATVRNASVTGIMNLQIRIHVVCIAQ
jgi:hypothetical protein